ncbi:30S ribosomal protein S20 [bacterium]|jgi:ribosomal protein S20|nr:30S ribosomal protein S20 [bacterium]
MPNKKSAIKYLRKSSKRNEHNSLIKRNIKELIKRGKKAIADGNIKEVAPELTHDLQKAIDKAVKSGILKANAGDRKKSRFMEKVNKALNAAPVKEEVSKEKK